MLRRKMIIPNSIKEIIGNRTYEMDTIGKSDSSVVIFDDMALKIQKQGEEADNELRIMEWIHGRLPVPKVIAFEEQDGYSFLLMSKAEGKMSCVDAYLQKPSIMLKWVWWILTTCSREHLVMEALKILSISFIGSWITGLMRI